MLKKPQSLKQIVLKLCGKIYYKSKNRILINSYIFELIDSLVAA